MSTGNGTVPFTVEALFTGDAAWMTVMMPPDYRLPARGVDGEPWQILIAAPNSKAAIRAMTDMTRAHAAIRQAGREANEGETLDRAIKLAVGRTLDWRHPPATATGGPLEYSPEAAEWLYSNSEVVLGQVDVFFGNQTNYLRTASNSFSDTAVTSLPKSVRSPARAAAQ